MQYALALFTVFCIGVIGNVLEFELILWPTIAAVAWIKTRK